MNRRSACTSISLLTACLALAGQVHAQESTPPVATQPAATQPVATRPVAPVRPELTAEMIESWIKEVQQRADLDDPAKTKVVGLYQQALQQLETAQKWKTTAVAFEQEAQQAPAELAAITTRPAPPETAPVPPSLTDKTLVQLEQELAKAKTELAEHRKLLDQYENEPKRRANRRTEIARLVTTAKQKLDEITPQLAAAPDASKPSALAQAERTLVRARGRALRAELTAYEKEIANFDATVELVTARRDLAARLVSQANKRVQDLQESVNQKRRDEAEKQQREALEALHARANAHPVVHTVAEENADLVQRRTLVASRMEQTPKSVDELTRTLEQIKKDRRVVEDKVNAAGVTRVLGLLLRQQRGALPNTRELRRHLRTLQDENATVELALIDLRRQGSELARTDPRQELANALDRIDPSTPAPERAEIKSALQELLGKRREYLASLMADSEIYFKRLLVLQEAEEGLVQAVETYTEYIDEHILWLRSHPELNAADFPDALDALQWMTAPGNWARVARTLGRDCRRYPLRAGLALLLFVGLFLLHRTLRHRLAELGKKAAQSTCSSFAPTARALADTALLVLPWPLLLWFLAWRLGTAANGDESDFARVVAAGLRTVALALLTAEGFRQVCRAHGLAHAHLDWSPSALKLVRRQLRWLMVIGLPIVFVVATIEAQENSAWEDSLARIAFIVGLAALMVFAARVLHPRSGALREYLAHHRHGRIDRLRYVWYAPSVGAPVLLAVLAGLGYYYTALELTWRLQATAWFVLVITTLRGLILRWLLLARRKLAIAQARKRLAERKAKEEAKAEGEPATEDTVAAVPEPLVDLSAVSVQTRQLFGSLLALATIIGLWLIWVDVLPALGMLKKIHPWPDAPITLADLALAGLALVVTVIVTRNVPGFLEITLLPRLPLDAGQRYAIVTIFKYLVTAIGVIVACTYLGIGWSKVQWLVAAVTVGLGFGLQEIFANFVSGLIILFERPIRIGDTVTVGNISGTVSRIRIRATTITGWDRKELIIPNKEFVTGQVINWTLSDSVLRVVVPVGVAYGSDTDLAERLLRQVADEHPLVLDDPAPMVLLNQFGDNSLNFELRVFVASVDHSLQVRHDLHRAIDRAFRQAGIEIAFPQRDIHIRSVKDVFPLVDQRREAPRA